MTDKFFYFYKIQKYIMFTHTYTYILAQSAGAAKYADCFSAEGLDPNECPYMALNHLMVRLQYARALGDAEYLFIAIAPRYTLAWSGST